MNYQYHNYFDNYQGQGFSECESQQIKPQGQPFNRQNEEERSKLSVVLEGTTVSPLDHTTSYQENSPHYQHEGHLLDLYIQPFSQPLEVLACRVQPDGGNRSQKERSWLTHPEEHGANKLPTAKHNEYDVLTYSEPTNGKGISDRKDFSKETYRNASRLIPDTITSEQWESAAQGTIKKRGDVRFDNQGDITLPGGRRFTNFQLQCGEYTMACVVMEKGKDFSVKHMRGAFHESLEKKIIVHLHCQTDTKELLP